MTTVIVTGAAGFIGRALCAQLESDGVLVLRVLRGQTLPRAPGAYCVHLAGSSRSTNTVSDEANVRGQAEELAANVLAAGYERIVFASTAHVYDNQASMPCREHSPTAPASDYARLKFALEPFFSSAPHAVARLSNVYGPGQSPVNVVSDILRQLPGNGVVRLRGSPEAVRDYLFVEDAAKGLARLALSQETGIFNLSTGQGTGVREIVAQLASSYGIPCPRIESSLPPRPSTLVLDPELAGVRLGWRAEIPLEDGLQRLLCASRL